MGLQGQDTGLPHPAPSCVELRARLAHSIEPAIPQFQVLLATAAASESSLLRAALVRLCARAAGGVTCFNIFLLGMCHEAPACQPERQQQHIPALDSSWKGGAAFAQALQALRTDTAEQG